MPAEVEVFSGPNCVHCEAAKQLLNDSGLEFVERRVDDPDERRLSRLRGPMTGVHGQIDRRRLDELRRRLPRAMALPQIFVDGSHIGNDDDLRIRKADGRSPFDA